MSRAFSLVLSIRPEWAGIEEVRASAVATLTAVYRNPEQAESLGMAVGELVENALKYGDWRNPAARAELHLSGDQHRIVIAVAQPSGSADHVRNLEEIIARIARAPSAEEAYVERMREVAVRTEGSGGLGLTRIAFESRCLLSVEQRADGVLVMSAETAAIPRNPGDQQPTTFS